MQKTSIEYLDMTWNPIAMRCTPVSAGCEHCWHLRMCDRLDGIFSEKALFGACNSNVRNNMQQRAFAYQGLKPWLNTKELSAPLKRKKPARIGVQFMGDLFQESVPFEWIASVYGVMAASPQHTYFILTKRPERRFEFFELLDEQECSDVKNRQAVECAYQLLQIAEPYMEGPIHSKYGPSPDAPWPLQNVLEGVSVENQETADERILWLLKTPAEKRWVSYEPALGPVEIDISKWGRCFHSDRSKNHNECSCHLDLWVSGSETGPGARPADLDWFRSARDQCAEAGVPFFFKRDSSGSRLLDGRKHEELP